MNITDRIHAILVGVDDAAAAALFSSGDDVTISSRCGMALIDHQRGVCSTGHGFEQATLDALAAGLNDLEKRHCILAIQADAQRAADVIRLLEPYLTPGG